MNKRERRETEERGRLQTIVFACILYERFTRNYGNFAGRFARVESYSFDSLPTKRAPRLGHRARWNAKRFRIATPGVGIHFFQSKSRIRAGRERDREGTGREEDLEGGGRGWGALRRGGWRGNRAERRAERESPHMKPLSPPIQQYFYIYYPYYLHRWPLLPPPFLCPYPLIWSPQPNKCTSTAGLTLTVAGRSFQPAWYREAEKPREHFRLRLLLLRIRLPQPHCSYTLYLQVYRYTWISFFCYFFPISFFPFSLFSFFCLPSPSLFLLFRRDTTYILFSFLFSLTPLLGLAYFLQFSCFRFHASTPPPLLLRPLLPLLASVGPALRVGNWIL